MREFGATRALCDADWAKALGWLEGLLELIDAEVSPEKNLFVWSAFELCYSRLGRGKKAQRAAQERGKAAELACFASSKCKLVKGRVDAVMERWGEFASSNTS